MDLFIILNPKNNLTAASMLVLQVYAIYDKVSYRKKNILCNSPTHG